MRLSGGQKGKVVCGSLSLCSLVATINHMAAHKKLFACCSFCFLQIHSNPAPSPKPVNDLEPTKSPKLQESVDAEEQKVLEATYPHNAPGTPRLEDAPPSWPPPQSAPAVQPIPVRWVSAWGCLVVLMIIDILGEKENWVRPKSNQKSILVNELSSLSQT